MMSLTDLYRNHVSTKVISNAAFEDILKKDMKDSSYTICDDFSNNGMSLYTLFGYVINNCLFDRTWTKYRIRITTMDMYMGTSYIATWITGSRLKEHEASKHLLLTWDTKEYLKKILIHKEEEFNNSEPVVYLIIDEEHYKILEDMIDFTDNLTKKSNYNYPYECVGAWTR